MTDHGFKSPTPLEQIVELFPTRFCTTKQIASVFGFKSSWIYKLNSRGKGPPAMPKIKPPRYDTRSSAFREWLEEMGVELREVTDRDTGG